VSLQKENFLKHAALNKMGLHQHFEKKGKCG
jgi:hypothetical protein